MRAREPTIAFVKEAVTLGFIGTTINDAPREGPVGLTRVRVSWAGGFIRQHFCPKDLPLYYNATTFDEGFVSPSRFHKICSISQPGPVALLSYFSNATFFE